MMQRYTEEFLQELDGFDLATLENDSSCIYGLRHDLTLQYMNPAWYEFAQKNAGEPAISQYYCLGTPIEAALAEPYKSFLTEIYRGLLISGEVWQQEYNCSSANVARTYQQTVYPLRNQSGLLIVNSLRIDIPPRKKTPPAGKRLTDRYVEVTGLITACMRCKRVHRAAKPGIWDSVPRWKASMPPNTSHSLCAICYDYFYKHLYKARV